MVAEAIDQQMRSERQKGKYGWIIDTDFDETPDKPGGDAGTMGPSGIPGDIEEQLKSNPKFGRRFEMSDGDGILLYAGRIFTRDDPGTELDFAPLDDFGTGSGCTSIWYWTEDLETLEVADQEKAAERGGYHRLEVVNVSDAYGETWYRVPVRKDSVSDVGGWAML